MSHWQVRGDALLQITFASLSGDDGGGGDSERRLGCDYWTVCKHGKSVAGSGRRKPEVGHDSGVRSDWLTRKLDLSCIESDDGST